MAHIPVFVPVEDMRNRLPATQISQTRGPVGTTGGLTDVEFFLRFSNWDTQWQRLPHNRWQFQGGRLYLDLDITIFVSEEYRYLPDVVNLIMEHEILHVQDEYRFLMGDLRGCADNDRNIVHYLRNQTPVDDGLFQIWAHPAAPNNRFDANIRLYWITEHNRMKIARDSSPETRRQERRIEDCLWEYRHGAQACPAP
jgi:hypothetical protein